MATEKLPGEGVWVDPSFQRKKQAGDIFISYHGEKIANQLDMQRAKNKAGAAKAESIALVIERDGKQLELKIDPGPLGVLPLVEFADPTFK